MPRQVKLSVLFFGFAALFFMACNSVYTPKPTGYYKINFPEKKYSYLTSLDIRMRLNTRCMPK